MGKNSLYVEIANQIRHMILNDKELTFIPSERELASKFNAERMTVRRGLKVLVDEGLLISLPGRGTLINPNVRRPQYSFALEGEKNIQFVLSSTSQSMRTQFITNLFVLLEKYCLQFGYKLHYCCVENGNNKHEMQQMFSNTNGVIFFGMVDESYVREAQKLGISVVLLNSTIPDIPAILFDNLHGGYKAASHLIRQGCSRIAFISVPGNTTSAKRFNGYCQALASHKIEREDDLIVNGNWGFESGYNGALELINKKISFDALLAGNDEMALGAIRALRQHDIIVPDMIKVVGFDNIEAGAYAAPSLTTVDFHPKSLAWVTLTMLRHIMNEGVEFDTLIIPSELIVRESSQ